MIGILSLKSLTFSDEGVDWRTVQHIGAAETDGRRHREGNSLEDAVESVKRGGCRQGIVRVLPWIWHAFCEERKGSPMQLLVAGDFQGLLGPLSRMR